MIGAPMNTAFSSLVFRPWADPVDSQTELTLRIGGKAASLFAMGVVGGINVPSWFCLGMSACRAYLQKGWTDDLEAALRTGVRGLEEATGQQLGRGSSPLLLSVRSGSSVSMPGMMATVLNIGMTSLVEDVLARRHGVAFAQDVHRRFLLSYAKTVGGIASAALTVQLGRRQDIDPLDLRKAIEDAGYVVPEDPAEQVIHAVGAIFSSWMSPEACGYRARMEIDANMGTAATIQKMVFGNAGDRSGSGVAFSRNPSSGEPGVCGEFVVNAQGEDVVAGTHQPLPLEDMRALWPTVYEQLVADGKRLERTMNDVVEIEFTVEDGALYLLQSRIATRSTAACFRVAVDMAEDPNFPLDRAMAVARCAPFLDKVPPAVRASDPLVQVDRPSPSLIGKGIGASPGYAGGYLCLDLDEAAELAASGKRVVLARRETSPSDVRGIAVASGLVTSVGGFSSHAAVVARGWGIPAVVGLESLSIGEDAITCGALVVKTGAMVSVDGSSGEFFLGSHPVADAPIPEVLEIRRWASDLGYAQASIGGRDQSTFAERSEMPIDSLARLGRYIAAKGEVSLDNLTATLHGDIEIADKITRSMIAMGWISTSSRGYLPTENLLNQQREFRRALREQHAGLIRAILLEFDSTNHSFKELVTAWQARFIDGAAVPNDHSDSRYDSNLLARLRFKVHAEILELLRRPSRDLPHLNDFITRLNYSLTRLEAGDGRYMAHPMVDSYHTVWFELHEELLDLADQARVE